MKYRLLGSTGVHVSELCLGTMTFGGANHEVGALEQEEVDRIVGVALDQGVNFFDTANIYSAGQAETMLGKALGSRRKDALITTKVRARMGAGVNQVGLSRLHIIAELEASLKRLGTDHVDLYMVHSVDPLTPIEQTLRALDDMVRSGKVRFIGCSNFSAWQLMKSLSTSEFKGLERFCCIQAYYSLVGRDIERELVPLLQAENVALTPWSPLAGGLLSGKYTRNGGDARGRRSRFDFPPADKERTWALIEAMQVMADSRKVRVAQIALAWLLHKPFVTSPVVGVRTLEQLRENLDAVHVLLTREEMSGLDTLSALPPEYPGWVHALLDDRRPVSDPRLSLTDP